MKVLIAVDESSLSGEIIDYVLSQNWQTGSEFTVMHVVQDLFAGTYVTVLPPAILEEMSKEAWSYGENLVRKAAIRLRDAFHSTKINELVLSGRPAAVILNEADRENTDLIVLGSHKRSGMERLFLGSVSAQIAAHAPCSVLVVAAAKAEQQGKEEKTLQASGK